VEKMADVLATAGELHWGAKALAGLANAIAAAIVAIESFIVDIVAMVNSIWILLLQRRSQYRA
jgi:hypothetical protein